MTELILAIDQTVGLFLLMKPTRRCLRCTADFCVSVCLVKLAILAKTLMSDVKPQRPLHIHSTFKEINNLIK
uniref:Secreted protein n=1 Tax=Schistosoma mansoni TaxID=6183 RepID=A0A5K4F530_SCHMA